MRRASLAAVGAAGVIVALLGFATIARSSDHQDGPQASFNLAADIADVYAWTSADGTKVNLVLDVFPFAIPQNKFSPSYQYVFHTESTSKIGTPGTPLDIICTFDDQQNISCWLGEVDYVNGNASNPVGLVSLHQKMQVFAGFRDDPDFWNRAGFQQFAANVKSSFGGFTYDDAGCPLLSDAQASATETVLQSGLGGAPPSDAFAKANILSIVMSVDRATLTAGGPILAVWASTRRSP